MLGNFLFNNLLGLVRVRPPRPQQLTAALQFHKGPAGVIPRAPQGHKQFARFKGPSWRGKVIGHTHAKVFGVGIHHVDGVLGSDRLAETVLGLQHRAINTGLQDDRERSLALGIGLEGVFTEQVRQFPGIRVGWIRLRPRRSKLGADYLIRLFQRIDLDQAFGRLGLTVDGLGRDSQLHRFIRRLPGVCANGGLQCGISGTHDALGRARLARGVGHICVDSVLKYRLIFLKNRQIRFGREENRKRAVGFCHCGAMGNRLCLGRRVAPADPPAPDRKPHLAHNAPCNLPPPDGCSGVRRGLARHDDLGVEPGRLRGRFELNLELGSLVFLHVEACVPVRTIPYGQGHPPHQAVPGGREAAAESAVVIALVLLPGNLLAVGILEHHG